MTIATELVVVRHGESNCNVAGIAGGERGCTGLSPHGREQAQHLADRLDAEHRCRPFDAFYCSPRRRARETADIIGLALGAAPTIADDLRHLDHGAADGRTWKDINAEFHGPPQNRPAEAFAPGAESWYDYLRRATAALRGILDRHTGERILLVAHGETVEAAHTLLLNLPPTSSGSVGFLTDNAAVARWQEHLTYYDHPVWMLAAHNDRSHLR